MPLREDSPQIPETPYGTTKLAAEWLIKDYAAGLRPGLYLAALLQRLGRRPRWRAR